MPIPRSPEDRAIERWARLSLTEQFAETLREPLPDQWLKLLDGKP